MLAEVQGTKELCLTKHTVTKVD